MIFRILLVDDETAVVDWLEHIIRQTCGDSVDIYKTSSSVAALKMLNASRFDILILDMNMPVVNGISILDSIAETCLETKVIILTGYQRFEYVRKALDKQVVAYVLKDENDGILLEAVQKAMEKIKWEIEQKKLMDAAKKKLAETEPILRREFILRLVQGLLPPNNEGIRSVIPINLKILPDMPVCVLICSAKCTHADAVEGFRTLFAAGMTVEEAIDRNFCFECAMPDETSWVWLIQKKDGNKWDDTANLMLRAAIENAQITFNRNTNGNLQFVYGSKPVPLHEASDYYMRLRPLQGFVKDEMQHVVLTDENVQDGEDACGGGAKGNQFAEPAFEKALVLQRLLEQGERTEFKRVLDGLLALMESAVDRDNISAVETFLTVSTVMISYINKTGMASKLPIQRRLYKLCRMELHYSWKEAADYFKQLSDMLFEMQKKKRDAHSEFIVKKVKNYITEHLHEELTLISLADKVFLNPSYFSVLFKMKTGMNISEFIKLERLKKAKALLREKKFRINEISRMVGYGNAAYFTKFFKMETGLTPQEFRDKSLDGAGLFT